MNKTSIRQTLARTAVLALTVTRAARTLHHSAARSMLAIVLIMLTTLTAQATDFITDVIVIGGSKTEVNNLKSSLGNQGWTVIDQDLNAGAGGDYIFLLYKSESSSTNVNLGYVTGFYIDNEYKASITYQGRTYYPVAFDGGLNFKNSKGDLNRGADGEYIYLYYTQDYFADNRAITGITFNKTQSGGVGLQGSTTGYDLNAGAGGDYVYMHLTTSTTNPPLSGSGTTASPFLIGTAEDWKNFAIVFRYNTYVDKCYKLTADISVTKMVGTSGQPFRGTFDGDGHTLAVNLSGSEQYVAPFSYTDGATIHDLTVAGTVSGSHYAGGIVGYAAGTLSLQNCVCSTAIRGFGNYAGGLLGWCDNLTLTMTNCLFKGSFSPSGSGKYHPIACKDAGKTVTATVTKTYYLNTITPTVIDDNIISGAEGDPVNTEHNVLWSIPVAAPDGITYYASCPIVTVDIAEGINTLPTLPFNMRKNYSLSEQIYTVEEVGMAGTITSIAFHYAGTEPFSLEGVQVYLKHTDKEVFDNHSDMVPLSVSDKVYEGSFSAQGPGWITINLDTPFEYDGSNSLLVCCLDPTDGHIGGDDWTNIYRFYYHNTGDFSRVSLETSNDSIPCLDKIHNYGDNLDLGEKVALKFRSDIRLNIVSSMYPNPDNLGIGHCTEQSATLTWEAPKTNETITGYAYQYKKVSDDQWSAEVTLGSTATSATLSGLSAFTDYQFRVRTLYGDNTSSYAYFRFTTAVPLPYDFGFENGMVGWYLVDFDWNHGGINTDSRRSGTYGFEFHSADFAPQYLVSPRLPNTNAILVSFYYRDKRPDSGYKEAFQVGYSTKTNDINDYTWKPELYASNIPWTLCENTFPAGTNYIAIRFNTSLSNGLYLDDFSFVEYSPYAKPTGLTVSDLTDHSVKLTWTAPNNASPTEYAYQYKKPNDDVWSDEAKVKGTSFTLGNLSDNTTYDFRVKALYEGGNASNYVSTRFMTEGTAISLPYDEGFENGMGGWRIVDGDLNTKFYFSTKEGAVHSGTGGFEFISQYYQGPYQYLISPEFVNTPNMKVSFWYTNYNTSASFQVGYSTTTKDPNAFTWDYQVFARSEEWQEYVTFFPAGTKYVAVKRMAGIFLYLDDFSFTQSEFPATPQQLAATNLTATSADLSWTGATDSYRVRYITLPLFHDEFTNGLSQWKVVRNGEGTDDTDWHVYYDEKGDSYYALSRTYLHNTAYDVDNWLISSEVTLDGTLSFYVAQNIDFPVHYEVLLSTTTDDLNAFTKILEPGPPAETGKWEKITFDLSSYQRQKGYIAFRLKDKNKDYLAIDGVNIRVGGDYWEFMTVTGESAEVTGLLPFTTYDYQVRGIQGNYYTDWSDAFTFTTNGIIPLHDNADNTEAIASINDSQAHSVMLHGRTLWKDGNWNTLCLPFGVSDFTGTPLEGATVMELDTDGTYSGNKTGYDAATGTLYLYFKNASEIVAGKPYIIRWGDNGGGSVGNNYNTGSVGNNSNSANLLSPVFSGVTVDASAPTAVTSDDGKVTFVGSYAPLALTIGDQGNLFVGAQNALHYPDAANNSDGNYYVNACRAYFAVGNGGRPTDMDNSGTLTITDVALMINHILTAPTTSAYTAADVTALANAIISKSAPQVTISLVDADGTLLYQGVGSSDAR